MPYLLGSLFPNPNLLFLIPLSFYHLLKFFFLGGVSDCFFKLAAFIDFMVIFQLGWYLLHYERPLDIYWHLLIQCAKILVSGVRGMRADPTPRRRGQAIEQWVSKDGTSSQEFQEARPELGGLCLRVIRHENDLVGSSLHVKKIILAKVLRMDLRDKISGKQ